MPVIEISSLSHPGVEMFCTLTEAQLRNRIEPDKGIFIVESPKVITRALDAGYEPLAILCEHKHITGDASDIIERCSNVPVYTGESIIRKTKCFDFWERNVLFPKTKRSFFRTPTPLPCPFPLNFSLLIITKKFGNLAKNRYICIV